MTKTNLPKSPAKIDIPVTPEEIHKGLDMILDSPLSRPVSETILQALWSAKCQSKQAQSDLAAGLVAFLDAHVWKGGAQSKETTETPAPREIGDDEQTQIPVTRKELAVLFDAARSLALIKTLEEADPEAAIVNVAILLETTADPAWQVTTDLQGRFREAELRAAGHGEKLDRLEKAVKTMGGGQ